MVAFVVNLGGEEAPASPPQVAPDPSTQVITVSASTVTVVHTAGQSPQAGQSGQAGQSSQPGQTGQPGGNGQTSPDDPATAPPGVTTTGVGPTGGTSSELEATKQRGKDRERTTPQKPSTGPRT
ncbi:hypothetical protein ADL03_43905 [Nocardia sp. NRRL S-836]|nr:hypothetical protein ADL03_43905 [Nocardia sp. NRRL S-836]